MVSKKRPCYFENDLLMELLATTIDILLTLDLRDVFEVLDREFIARKISILKTAKIKSKNARRFIRLNY